MALQHPIAVYTAGSTLEAHGVCEMLMAAGIEAAVVEDDVRAAAWVFADSPGIQRSQVWVERADVERARLLVAEFERRQVAREKAAEDGPPIYVVCEECRRTTSFPASRLGRVESCSHCGAFVDVGDDPGFEGWEAGDADKEA